MTTITSRLGGRRATALVALAAAVALLMAIGSANAQPPKHYTLEISPTAIAGSEGFASDTVTFTFTSLQTTAGGITLGSANVTIPEGVTVTDPEVENVTLIDDEGTSIIEFRNMNIGKGESASWSFAISAACPEEDDAVDYTWVVEAKQSNDFAGVGNDFTLNGDYPVLTVTCDDDDEEEPSEEPTTDQTGPSPRFTPDGGWDESVFCPGNSPCPDLESSMNGTSAKLSSPNATALFLAIRDSGAVPMDCGTDFAAVSDAVYFDVIGNPQGKTIAITLEGAGGEPGDYEVCFGGDKPWTQADGSPAVFDGDTFFVGIVGECAATPGRRPAGAKGGLGQPVACIDMNASSTSNGDVTIVLRVPPGDPLIKIG